VIRTTPEHPFYVQTKGWTPAGELEIGDLLAGHCVSRGGGHWTPVTDLLDTGEWETVYNFRIADYHTYFVGDDDWGFSVWAHNPETKEQERFMFNVGRLRGNRLAQADLGAGARTDEGYQVLKGIARELKRRTKPGVWVIGETGNVGFAKDFRLSKGAKDASRMGEVQLVSLAFTQLFVPDPPFDDASRDANAKLDENR
jgi:intein/homing endonuclease